jgi:hypothetical protein
MNRLLYQLSYVGFSWDHSSLPNRSRSNARAILDGSRQAFPRGQDPLSNIRPAPKLCRASGGQGVVFNLRLRRQQNPEGIHSDGRTERNVRKPPWPG